jgi:hypothetical protein
MTLINDTLINRKHPSLTRLMRLIGHDCFIATKIQDAHTTVSIACFGKKIDSIMLDNKKKSERIIF